jgi:hypothetical protein
MTPRYKLRTLLILLAILPPLLWIGWMKYEAWRAEQERQRALREAQQQHELSYSTYALPQPIAPTVDPPGVPRAAEDRPSPAEGGNPRQ